MTYVVTENCIKCKFMDCVEVCPVDCFYEGENMLVIHPDECIDCGVCEPECPAEAIQPDTESGAETYIEIIFSKPQLHYIITVCQKVVTNILFRSKVILFSFIQVYHERTIKYIKIYHDRNL